MKGTPAPADRYDSFLFDMDGVLYLNREPIRDAVRFVNGLREKGRTILFLTNNSKFTRSEYRDKLAGMGIGCEEGEIMTSAAATAGFLAES